MMTQDSTAVTPEESRTKKFWRGFFWLAFFVVAMGMTCYFVLTTDQVPAEVKLLANTTLVPVPTPQIETKRIVFSGTELIGQRLTTEISYQGFDPSDPNHDYGWGSDGENLFVFLLTEEQTDFFKENQRYQITGKVYFVKKQATILGGVIQIYLSDLTAVTIS